MKKVYQISLLLVVMAVFTGCSKETGICKDTEAIKIQNLYSIYIQLEDSNNDPIPLSGPITLVVELHQCDGTIGKTEVFSGQTDSYGIFHKTVQFTLDNTEERLLFYAYYGDKLAEDSRWVEYSDISEPFGHMTIQMDLVSDE